MLAPIFTHDADKETNYRFLLVLVETSFCPHTGLQQMKEGWSTGLHLSNNLVPTEALEVFWRGATKYGPKTLGAHHSEL